MDEAVMVALRLSKAGYGRPDEVLDMNCDLVLAAIEYEKFIVDFQSESIEINRVIK
jgi:hypothetical protein